MFLTLRLRFFQILIILGQNVLRLLSKIVLTGVIKLRIALVLRLKIVHIHYEWVLVLLAFLVLVLIFKLVFNVILSTFLLNNFLHLLTWQIFNYKLENGGICADVKHLRFNQLFDRVVSTIYRVHLFLENMKTFLTFWILIGYCRLGNVWILVKFKQNLFKNNTFKEL